jgi:hypothetical protein
MKAREGLRVRGLCVLADRDVQLSVGPEVERAAIVVGDGRVDVEQDGLAARLDDVWVVGAGGEPADAVVRGSRPRGGHGVVHVEVAGGGKVGVEGDAQQAALGGRTDHVQVEELGVGDGTGV